ncbi:hypothetical protein [Catenovulum sediminis]|uniref:Orphan protein n=1 Tax=Catenovulum sediminis TaxID=1740262 RepID=A0ABV1RI15_9ALTE|nr:hypothetical protein [Catenovulum sediminis]
MKELVSVHEFLVQPDDLSDWHLESELAADNYNQVIHCLYQNADEDIDTEKLTTQLANVWQALAADEYLTEFEDESEIVTWVEEYLAVQTKP